MRTTVELDRILVVDDEPAIRFFLSEELRDAGYEVAAAASGEEALAYLEQHPVDLVLLDQRMPGMDGLQTMAEIRRRPHPPEVIMLTAHATLDTAITAMRQGGGDFLTKPCDTADLLVSVRRGLLRRKKALKRDAMAHLIADTARQLMDADPSAAPLAASPPSPERYLHGQDLLLDQTVKVVRQAGEELALTPTEFDLLAAFMSRPDRPLDYVELVLEVLGQKMRHAVAQDALGTHLWRLRRKLGDSPKGGPYIVNVRGRGYKFVS